MEGGASSWVDKDGDWRQKKVSLMGAVQSFISQLKIGQDLTRVSLPCLFLYPFSMLEVLAHRELSTIETVFAANTESDPKERLIAVTSWLLATLPQERWIKKPYNPVIGETHEGWIESKEHGRTVFTGEQVSHHPPVSAAHVRNVDQQVDLSASLSFGVRYGGNSVSIVTSGGGKIHLGKFNEDYEFPKRLPDMVVRHLIFGKKKIYWEGDLKVTCPQTKLQTTLNFSKSGAENAVKGKIEDISNPSKPKLIYTINGKCGEVIYLSDDNSSRILVDFTGLHKSIVKYLPLSEMDDLSSLKVWAEVNKYLMSEELDKADEAKKHIEEDQRKRIAAKQANGTMQAKFFAQQEHGWTLKVDPPLFARFAPKESKSEEKK